MRKLTLLTLLAASTALAVQQYVQDFSLTAGVSVFLPTRL